MGFYEFKIVLVLKFCPSMESKNIYGEEYKIPVAWKIGDIGKPITILNSTVSNSTLDKTKW